MKKKLKDILDNATPAELDAFADDQNAIDLPPDVLTSVKNKVYAKTNIKRKTARSVWLRLGAIAACFAVVVGVVVVILHNRVPTWDTAHYSASEIAQAFKTTALGPVATNSYTKVYVPDSEYLYIEDIPDDDYLEIYQRVNQTKELNEAELQSFIDSFIPKLAESLGASVPNLTIKKNKINTDNRLSASTSQFGLYSISVDQNETTNSVSFRRYKDDRQIVIAGETLQIDQRLSDEEILASIQSIKNKLFDIFNVSFSDAKIIRKFGPDSKYVVEQVYIYLYNEDAHFLNSIDDIPISDFISIRFDNISNYAGDIVSDSILSVSHVSYGKRRVDMNNSYTLIAKAKRISINEAENLLYKGYVFGGHSCPLCMAEQEKVSFDGYDFVGIEHRFGKYKETDENSVSIPFYVFYKNIGTSENGNTIYAKTYVPAIEIGGYEEYFRNQEQKHNFNNK